MAFYNYTEGYLDIGIARMRNCRIYLKPDTRDRFEENSNKLNAFKSKLDALVAYVEQFGRSQITDEQFASVMTDINQFITENI